MAHASSGATQASNSLPTAPTTLTLQQLNAASAAQFEALLTGIYEHSPWIVAAAHAHGPFAALAQLKYALASVVQSADVPAQLALLRAHPELAGKAMVDNTLTAESTLEQNTAGLTRCTEAEFQHIQQLNREYNARFEFPFILAVRGPRGTGLSKREIIATFERRLNGHPETERQEALRNVHRIAELRLNDRFGIHPVRGNEVWDQLESLAQFSEPEYAARNELTVTYLSDAHRACARHIQADMLQAGCDSVSIDAVGNVVGIYKGQHADARTLLTGSHYDTVRNAGKYDGRLGIYVPLACISALHRSSVRLPFALEVVAFAEEEGQRYSATFLGSGALCGRFDQAWLDQRDAAGISMREAMQEAGLDYNTIASLCRDASRYLAFVEVHIEQGPVLNSRNLPLGVVTSINASVRYQGAITGTASHAGTTPMNQRQDAATAVAELALFVERRAAADGDSVGTIGQCRVPNGSVNVVPGLCEFSLDVRAPTDAQRDAVERDIQRELAALCERRQVRYALRETMRASAAPSAPEWQQRWASAVSTLGLPVHCLPSGAGHDAMQMHQIMPQAMLFVRGENAGISHNPLESTTSDDIELAIHAFDQLLQQLGRHE